MKPRRLFFSCAIAAALTGAAFAEDLNVQVKDAPVREKPAHLGTIIGNLSYGDIVTVKEQQGEGWHRVEAKPPSKLAGWVRTSDLTAKNLNVKNFGGSKSSATAGEAGEFGKGLLEKGEQSYVDKKGLQNAMATLDAIEKNAAFKSSPADIDSFLNQGQITPKEGK